jgi:GNAT superfamily N-acetyltransferase
MGKAFIRRAKAADASHIIIAHVRSIRELCAKDYTPEQIKAWVLRDFSTENWVKRMLDSWVWVVEKDSYIEGFCFLRASSPELCYLDALYFTPAVTGLGLGKEAIRISVEEAKKRCFKRMELNASLTSHSFYKKQGFEDNPASTDKCIFNGVEIPTVPMFMNL